MNRDAEYDAVVVGAGIGGLMTAAALARGGKKAVVLERLSFPGGRYTELDHRGYRVTTGAWTCPGPRGNIGRFCSEAGAPVDYVTLRDLRRRGRPYHLFQVRLDDGRTHSFSPFPPRALVRLASMAPERARVPLATPFLGLNPGVKEFLSIFPRGERADTMRALVNSILPRREPPDDISARAYISRYSSSDLLLRILDSMVGTASGLTLDTLPAGEYTRIIRDMWRAGMDFGFPAGGTRSIISALEKAIAAHGGEVRVNSPVKRIAIDGGRAVGVELEDGTAIRSHVVVHNAGARALLRLAGESHFPPPYVERIKRMKAVDCAAIIIGAKRPLIGDAAMLIPVGTRRVVGVFEPTFFDPGVAPPGRSMVDAFLPLRTGDVRRELDTAMEDLHALFPHLEEVAEFMLPMVFHKEWPGAECGQTFEQVGEMRLDPRTPVENLYLVGMDAKGSGVAGDLIPIGVRRALEHIFSS